MASSASDTVSASRTTALEQLERIELDRAYVGLSGSEDDDARTQRQAREYVSGVTRWQRWLDFLLSDFYNGSYEEMEPRLRIILRIGLYDLLFLHTPAHAAVNEHVELAKQAVRRGAGGLVNGILRAIDRQRDDLPTPNTGDPADDLAIRHSHPTWMVRRWLDRYGAEDTTRFLEWNNTRPFYGLRINTQRTTVTKLTDWLDRNEVEWTASPYLDDFVRVERLQTILRSGVPETGWCSVQDEAAGLAVRLLDPKPGETVIDPCAAPGGKSLYAAIRMQGEGRIEAYDQHESRLGLLDQASAEHGLEAMIHTQPADLRALAERPDPPQGDRVLVDAPCSGLGVLAKRADLRWQRAPGDLAQLADLQAALLDAAAKLVRPGGLLVYSTCTIEPEENEERVAAFLDAHDAFELESAEGYVPAEMITDEGYYTALPHHHGIDGAFGARLRRVA